MRKCYAAMAALLMLPTYNVKAHCRFWVYTEYDGSRWIDSDYLDILFVVNNASDKWMYLWMGHPGHGEDNGNLNLKPHSSATALGCSNGNGYAVTGIILTQGKDVLYTFDVAVPQYERGWVKMHPWKGGCYVAWSDNWSWYSDSSGEIKWDMSKMASKEWWDNSEVRVRIDCV